MSALTRFLDRHGLDEGFRAKAGLYASMATVAAVALLTPIQSAAAENYNGNRHSPIGGAGMAQRLGMVAERMTDRVEDLKAISDAMKTVPELRNTRDADIAARIVIEINNRLYQDTPYPQLADYDGVELNQPPGLAEGASMGYAIDAINFQKGILAAGNEALVAIVDGYQKGTQRDVNRALSRLDKVLDDYRASEPAVRETLVNSLNEMRSDNGWERGTSVDY